MIRRWIREPALRVGVFKNYQDRVLCFFCRLLRVNSNDFANFKGRYKAVTTRVGTVFVGCPNVIRIINCSFTSYRAFVVLRVLSYFYFPRRYKGLLCVRLCNEWYLGNCSCLDFLTQFFRLGRLRRLSLHSTPSKIRRIGTSASIGACTQMLTLAPGPAYQLVAPLGREFIISLSVLLLFKVPTIHLR